MIVLYGGAKMYKEILNKIKEYNKIIIIPHIRPDGDCLGSAFGLKYIVEEIFDKEVHVIGHHAADTQWLGEISTLNDEDFEGALVFSVDTGSVDRMIDKRAELGDFFIRIDHHPHVEHFGDIDYVDSSKPSTCTIITDMFRELELPIPKKASECLFFGTVTDTGRFKHKGVDQNTYVNAGYLLNNDIDLTEIYNHIYLKDISRLKLDKFVLNNFETTEFGFIYIKITTTDMKSLGLTTEDAGNAISKLENIIDYPVWAVLYELDGKIRGRLRSRGPVINEVAAMFQGGGHAMASGLTLNNWDELPSLLDEIQKVM